MSASNKAAGMVWEYYLSERRVMNKTKTEADDELRPEYDLKRLQVRKVGPERRRREILKNAKAGLKEFRDGKLTPARDIETLMEQLSDD
jgi:hypothetical protein